MNRSEEVFLDKFFRNKKIDTPLFHYTRAPIAEIIDRSKILRFTQFDCSSDSTEFRCGLESIVNELRKIARLDPISKAIFSKYVSFLESETKKPKIVFFMACFSNTRRCRYLWWNYGDMNKGKCLKFEFQQSEVDLIPTLLCRKVFYKRKLMRKWVSKVVRHYKSIVIKNVHSWAQKSIYEAKMSDLIIEFHRDVFSIAAFYKRRKFRHEREYRLTFWMVANDNRIKSENNKFFIELPIPTSLKEKIGY